MGQPFQVDPRAVDEAVRAIDGAENRLDAIHKGVTTQISPVLYDGAMSGPAHQSFVGAWQEYTTAMNQLRQSLAELGELTDRSRGTYEQATADHSQQISRVEIPKGRGAITAGLQA
jgi:WXG100 family type VII secretion target